MFNICLQDKFVGKSMKRIREKISETDLWVDGGFYSEKDLRDDLKLSETLVSIQFDRFS